MATQQQAQLVTEINKQTTVSTPVVVSPMKETNTQTPNDEITNQINNNNSPLEKQGQEGDLHKQSANPESANSQSPKDDSIMTKDERHSIGEDLKKSMRDLGRIPYLLILPIINLIQGQYEKIPESRRQRFGRMVSDIKTSGKGGIQKIKEWWAKRDSKTTDGKTEDHKIQDTKVTEVAKVTDGTKVAEAVKETGGAEETARIKTVKVTEGTNVSNEAKDTKEAEVAKVIEEVKGSNETEGAKATEVVKDEATITQEITNNASTATKTTDTSPVQSIINVETDSGKQLKVTTTIVEEQKA